MARLRIPMRKRFANLPTKTDQIVDPRLSDYEQDNFDQTIGRLDRVLSKLVLWGGDAGLDLPNRQTLKHHAEDMIAAGEKIPKDLGKDVAGTPQPK